MWYKINCLRNLTLHNRYFFFFASRIRHTIACYDTHLFWALSCSLLSSVLPMCSLHLLLPSFILSLRLKTPNSFLVSSFLNLFSFVQPFTLSSLVHVFYWLPFCGYPYFTSIHDGRYNYGFVEYGLGSVNLFVQYIFGHTPNT